VSSVHKRTSWGVKGATSRRAVGPPQIWAKSSEKFRQNGGENFKKNTAQIKAKNGATCILHNH